MKVKVKKRGLKKEGATDGKRFKTGGSFFCLPEERKVEGRKEGIIR